MMSYLGGCHEPQLLGRIPDTFIFVFISGYRDTDIRVSKQQSAVQNNIAVFKL